MKRRTQLVAILSLAALIALMPTTNAGAESSPWVISSSIESDRVVISLRSGDYRIIETEGEHVIEMEGFSYLRAPGKPLLPAKTFLIALPPGASATSVEVLGTSAEELSGIYHINSAQPVYPLVDSREVMERVRDEWRSSMEAVYSSDKPYPDEVARLTGSGTLRKYSYASVSFCPFSYHPQSGRLVYHRTAQVAISLELPPQGSKEALRAEELAWDSVADERASRMFVNYDQVTPLYEPKGECPDSFRQDHDYVIITTEALLGTVSSSAFVSWKASLGHDVTILTTTSPEITSQPGADLGEQIRSFLREYYIPWGIKYVLMVGNYTAVPMRYCYPNPDDHSHNPLDPSNPGGSVPTDYYYADLSLPDADSWDSDGDGFPGEYLDDDPDFLAEVYVGRIPVNNTARVSYTLDKLVTFEQDTRAWKRNALHAGAMLFFENQDYTGYPRVDGADIPYYIQTDLMDGWTVSRYCEHEGLDPSEYPWPALSEASFIDDWRTGQYAVVNWAGHGAPGSVHRYVWVWDDGDGVAETGSGEVEAPAFIGTWSNLDDDYPSIMFAVSCNVGRPEPTSANRLGVDLLTEPSWGACAGVVASSRVAWVSGYWPESPGGSESLCYEFNRFMLCGPDGPEKIGEAVYDSKHYCHVNYGWDHYAEHKNLFNYDFYGDPAMRLQGITAGVEDEIPMAFSESPKLMQNCPNPFNPRTEITYAIPAADEPSRVVLDVYDTLGRLVRTLVDGHQPPGVHRATWDATDHRGQPVASGVYFYRITWDGQSETRSMVLLK